MKKTILLTLLAALFMLGLPMNGMAQNIKRVIYLDQPYDGDELGYIKREGGWTNARVYPNSSAQIATKIKDGTKVMIGKSNGKWSRVYASYDGTYLGWVHNSKLVTSSSTLKYGHIKREGGYTNVRSSQSSNASIVMKIPDGTAIQYRKTSSAWWEVYNMNGTFLGYVHKSKIVSGY